MFGNKSYPSLDLHRELLHMRARRPARLVGGGVGDGVELGVLSLLWG